jgi:hypothetical protein
MSVNDRLTPLPPDNENRTQNQDKSEFGADGELLSLPCARLRLKLSQT